MRAARGHRRRDDGDRVPRQTSTTRSRRAAEELGFSAEIFDSAEDPNQQLQGIEGSSRRRRRDHRHGPRRREPRTGRPRRRRGRDPRRPGHGPRPQRIRGRDDQRRGRGHRHRRGHRRRRVRGRELPDGGHRDRDHRLPVDRVARRPRRHDRGVVHWPRTPTPSSSPRILGGTAENGVRPRWRPRCRHTPTSPACWASTTPATSAPTRRWRPPGGPPTTSSSSASTATRRPST